MKQQHMRSLSSAVIAVFMLFALCLTVFAGIVNLPTASAESVKATSQGDIVFIVPLEGEVNPTRYSFLKRSFDEAMSMGADTVIIEMDTPGGLLKSAEDIGKLISDSPMNTVVYIHDKAASAGSYIALSADQIAMSPGAAIGSAAIVDVNHKLIEDPKTNAFWISLMTGAAEKNGRDGEIARAMVDVNAEIELKKLNKVKPAGEVLSLNTNEAIQAGYAEYEASSMSDLLNKLNLSEALSTKMEMKTTEKIAEFINQPVVQTILLFLGIAGIAIELIVPGFGIPGLLGMLGFGLYFFGSYVAGLAGVETIVLFGIGIVLLVLELFVPSFGILGLLGSASLIGGVVRAAYDTSNAFLSLGIAFVAAVIVVVIVGYVFKSRGIWNRFILKEKLTTEEGYVSNPNDIELIGMEGVALTTLRPAGVARIGEKKLDVVTDGAFLQQGTKVAVIQVEGSRIVVRAIEE
ncbi:NfeD family protein [Paenibacillus sp. 1001270B_150601_E10]|uniref:NfeD family protein n=1 Tax=Paenibacillus sp. 1001270B_150601_E10 TaxID=2787079 RepID=UPI002B4BAC27|nr:NfeD family protein [Paenibacillus sp. 1001270B_150601_E10]